MIGEVEVVAEVDEGAGVEPDVGTDRETEAPVVEQEANQRLWRQNQNQ